MEDYIFNTTNEQIDTSELDKVIQFACKKMGVKNPLLNIVIVDNKYLDSDIIGLNTYINEEKKGIVKDIERYDKTTILVIKNEI